MQKPEDTTTAAGGAPLDGGVRRVRIKAGAPVGIDHAFGRWPCQRGSENVDVGTVFDAEFNGKHWECRADGYGVRTWLGEPGRYGNGSVFVFDADGVELLADAPNVEGNAGLTAQENER